MSAPRTRFTGRLVADPELSETRDGTPVCKIRVAVDGGGRNMEAGYYDVVQYGPGGKAAYETLTKGWLVDCEGRLEHRSWKDKETDKWREAIDIVGTIGFLAAPRTDEEKAAAAAASDGPSDLPAPKEATAVGAAGDDDIPF
jgi:single stranded DNA-binding protein